MRFLEIRGLKIEWQEWPGASDELPPIVLLHEGLGCVALWGQFPEKLALTTGCRVIAYSRPGYGRSDPYPNPRTVRYLHNEAEVILPEVLAKLGIHRPLLVGHSDGGSIALIFASLFPHIPSGLVVMAPHEFVEEVTLEGLRKARQAWQHTAWRERLGRYHTDPERVFREWNDTWLDPNFREWNIEDRLSAIRCPVLAIQGVDDPYATLRQIEVIAERVSDTKLLELQHCGHSPHRDQEATVLAAIAMFAQRVAGVSDAKAPQAGFRDP